VDIEVVRGVSAAGGGTELDVAVELGLRVACDERGGGLALQGSGILRRFYSFKTFF